MTALVERRLLPVLEALDEAAKKNDWFDKEYERQFEKLLKAKDNASREARITCMFPSAYMRGQVASRQRACTGLLNHRRSDCT